MAIERKEFDNEAELQRWVESNVNKFYGDIIYIPGFQITTRRNKGGTPDGFYIDIYNSSWGVIENELIKHGVWKHIAEQIIRFIVASQNPLMKKRIRDKFFEYIYDKKLTDKISSELEIPSEKLIQFIENIIDMNTPEITIFIDEKNEDLEDMVDALNTNIKIFRIQKYLTNGKIEYLSPDGMKSIIETSLEDIRDLQGKPSEIIEFFGGGKIIGKYRKAQFYELNNSRKITIRYSKAYDKNGEIVYWYGISPNSFEKYKEYNLSHIVFILGQEGLIELPIEILTEYITKTRTTKYPDGSIKHYHVYIYMKPEPILYIRKDDTINLDEYHYPLL